MLLTNPKCVAAKDEPVEYINIELLSHQKCMPLAAARISFAPQLARHSEQGPGLAEVPEKKLEEPSPELVGARIAWD